MVSPVNTLGNVSQGATGVNTGIVPSPVVAGSKQGSSTSASTGGVSADILTQVTNTLQSKNTLAPQLNAILARDRTTLSGLGQLQSALAKFETLAQSLSGGGLQTSATASTPGVLDATPSGSTAVGTYAVVVKQLAQSQVLQSKTAASASTPLGSGATATTLTFDFGSTTGKAFVPNSAASPTKSVVISPSNTSLQGIATAINDANIGVSAKVVSSGANFALRLQAPSGANSTLRIGVNGDPALQKLLANNPAGVQNLTQISAAQNAQLTVNGVASTSQTNTISGAITGAALNLHTIGSTSLVVAQNASQVGQNITNLVGAYNSLHAELNTLSQDSLKTDGTAARIQDQLSRALHSSIGTGSDGTSLNLGALGITFQANGALAIDNTKLQQAITADPAGVSKLFSGSGQGIADNLAGQVTRLVDAHGSIARAVSNTNKEVATVNAKKDNLAKALTLQANALVAQYTAQGALFGNTATDTSNSTGLSQQLSSGTSGVNSLFDLLG
jgi:flagellar hook-associated protein 2